MTEILWTIWKSLIRLNEIFSLFLTCNVRDQMSQASKIIHSFKQQITVWTSSKSEPSPASPNHRPYSTSSAGAGSLLRSSEYGSRRRLSWSSFPFLLLELKFCRWSGNIARLCLQRWRSVLAKSLNHILGYILEQSGFLWNTCAYNMLGLTPWLDTGFCFNWRARDT